MIVELGVELAAVGAERTQPDRLAEHGRLAGVEVPPEAVVVRVAQTRRDEQLGHLASDRVRAEVAERLLGCAVEVDDPAVVIHGHDRVGGGVQHGAVTRLRGQECLLRVRPVGEWVPHVVQCRSAGSIGTRDASLDVRSHPLVCSTAARASRSYGLFS